VQLKTVQAAEYCAIPQFSCAQIGFAQLKTIRATNIEQENIPMLLIA